MEGSGRRVSAGGSTGALRCACCISGGVRPGSKRVSERGSGGVAMGCVILVEIGNYRKVFRGR